MVNTRFVAVLAAPLLALVAALGATPAAYAANTATVDETGQLTASNSVIVTGTYSCDPDHEAAVHVELIQDETRAEGTNSSFLTCPATAAEWEVEVSDLPPGSFAEGDADLVVEFEAAHVSVGLSGMDTDVALTALPVDRFAIEE